MNRYAKNMCFPLIALLSGALAPSAGAQQTTAQQAASQQAAIIYKFVDEGGRVTYANSPIKGGAKVELEPLTIIPSTPSGSLRQSTHKNTPTPGAPSSGTLAMAVASVSTTSSAPTEFKIAPVNSVEAAALLSQQRRAEVKKKILEGELQTEEQLLAGARSQLEEEQKNSSAIRAMRASHAATPEAVTAQKPLISPAMKAEIERHFERIRNLQDQIAMHENNLAGMREQLVAMK